jgi:hypothetical protein
MPLGGVGGRPVDGGIGLEDGLVLAFERGVRNIACLCESRYLGARGRCGVLDIRIVEWCLVRLYDEELSWDANRRLEKWGVVRYREVGGGKACLLTQGGGCWHFCS